MTKHIVMFKFREDVPADVRKLPVKHSNKELRRCLT